LTPAHPSLASGPLHTAFEDMHDAKLSSDVTLSRIFSILDFGLLILDLTSSETPA